MMPGEKYVNPNAARNKRTYYRRAKALNQFCKEPNGQHTSRSRLQHVRGIRS